MLVNLLIIFVPLFIGYSIPLYKLQAAKKINHLIGIWLNYLIYVILFCMGLNLALLENVFSELKNVAFYSITFFLLITLGNLLGLLLFTSVYHKKNISSFSKNRIKESKTHWSLLKGAVELLFCVLIGFLLGIILDNTPLEPFLRHALLLSQYVLSLLIFLVAILLRQSRLSLKRILLNKVGMLLALTIISTSMISGILSGWLLNIELKLSLALASGFGWYSLSGILISDSYGPLYGSVAFFNDLAREILVIILIPLLNARYRFVSLGLSGATSMDFTLPLLQKHAGIDIVPSAIVQGFILSLSGIVLMTLLG